MRKLLAIVFFSGISYAGTATVTVNPSVTYQTWHYWMAILGPAPATVGTAEPATSPFWNTQLKAAVLGQLVNQLGLNTVQLTVASGDIENNVLPDGIHDCWTYYNLISPSNQGWAGCRYSPVNDDGDPNHFSCADKTLVNCLGSFPLAGADYAYDTYLTGPNGLKALVNANGEQFHIDFQWIHWPSSPLFADTSGAEAGEQIVAAFTHIRNKYGSEFVPDIIDMMVEPDLHCISGNLPAGECGSGGQWDFKKLGNAMYGIQTRLAASGFHPKMWCCSTTSSQRAKDWYANVKAQGPGTAAALTTHWYDAPDTSRFAANAAQAAADGVPVVMTELTDLAIDTTYTLLTQGNVSGVERYAMAALSNTDVPSTLLTVTSANPYASQYVSTGGGAAYTYFFPQLWHYVRENDVREQASSSDGNFLPLAFRSPAGQDKVIVLVHAPGNQTVNVTGVNPGTYGCTYTFSNAALLKPCGPNQTVAAGGTLTANFPAIPPNPPSSPTTAVVTFFAIAPQGAPAIFANGVVPIDSAVPVIQPGSWISIYGANLANVNAVWNGDFPVSLGGVSVTVNNKPGYLWLVSPGQINLQAPDDTATGPVPVVVTTPNGTATATVTLAPVGPSLSLLNSQYAAAVILTPDGSGAYGNGAYDLAGPSGAFTFSTRPVKPGETVSLYGVGLGPTTPPAHAGQPFSGASPTDRTVTVTIGGLPAPVSFAGIVSAGLYQVNVVVPNAGSGDRLVQASVSGIQTPNGIYIPLQ